MNTLSIKNTKRDTTVTTEDQLATWTKTQDKLEEKLTKYAEPVIKESLRNQGLHLHLLNVATPRAGMEYVALGWGIGTPDTPYICIGDNTSPDQGTRERIYPVSEYIDITVCETTVWESSRRGGGYVHYLFHDATGRVEVAYGDGKYFQVKLDGQPVVAMVKAVEPLPKIKAVGHDGGGFYVKERATPHMHSCHIRVVIADHATGQNRRYWAPESVRLLEKSDYPYLNA